MRKRTSSRSGLFLLELIISILFFSLASAVCIRLFVEAHVMDRNNRNLTRAVKLCENLAEIYTSVSGDVQALTEIYTGPFFTDTVSVDLAKSLVRYPHNLEVVCRVRGETGSKRTLYQVGSRILFLDGDWQPCMFPQSDGYVLCVVSFTDSMSTGEYRVASFGVWDCDTWSQGLDKWEELSAAGKVDASAVSSEYELAMITGNTWDDMFFQTYALDDQHAIYTLDVMLYVSARGGDTE